METGQVPVTVGRAGSQVGPLQSGTATKVRSGQDDQFGWARGEADMAINERFLVERGDRLENGIRLQELYETTREKHCQIRQ